MAASELAEPDPRVQLVDQRVSDHVEAARRDPARLLRLPVDRPRLRARSLGVGCANVKDGCQVGVAARAGFSPARPNPLDVADVPEKRWRSPPCDPRRGRGAASLPPRDGRGAAREGRVLLARSHRARPRGLRGPARRLQVPPARARGLRALRPAGRSSTTTATTPSSSSTAPRRTRTASSRCTASTPSATWSPSTATTARPSARSASATRSATSRSSGLRSFSTAIIERARRQLLPDPHRLRRPDRRARGRDLHERHRRAAPGDLRDEATVRRAAQGDRAASATCSPA